MSDESNEGIYGFYDPGNEVANDPSTLNLYELPMILAMSSWSAGASMEDDGTVNFFVKDMGGSGRRSVDDLTQELGLRDSNGEIIKGYSITDAEDGLELRYTGVANLRFADVAHRLYSLSPFNPEARKSSIKGFIAKLLGKTGLKGQN